MLPSRSLLAFPLRTTCEVVETTIWSLPAFAIAVYDVIMGSNLIAEKYDNVHGWGSSPEWNTVRKGLDWFRQHFAKEYMVLLD